MSKKIALSYLTVGKQIAALRAENERLKEQVEFGEFAYNAEAAMLISKIKNLAHAANCGETCEYATIENIERLAGKFMDDDADGIYPRIEAMQGVVDAARKLRKPYSNNAYGAWVSFMELVLVALEKYDALSSEKE